MTVRLGLLWPQSGALWTAGGLYFENLVTSLSLSGHGDSLVVIEPERGSYASAAGPDRLPVSTYQPAPEPTSRTQVLARVARRQLGLEQPDLLRAVRESGVDVAFGDVDLRSRFPVPWVGWIPDFQHLHYPEFFSASELAERDRIYRALAERASRVVLSSEDAFADFSRFVPEHADKGRVASFVSLFPDDAFAADPTDAAARYGVDGPYVIVPNQWWQHKNHEVAIRAAAMVAASMPDLRWVVTGALSDYRDDRHISRLLQLVSELHLRDRFVMLGALPRMDQVQLLRGAECIVQPSLFEGWSTVVEDAKSLGQRIVVSDIPVHREQDPGAALFFDPASPEDLADKLTAMLGGACERVDEAEARSATRTRAAAFGDRFFSICTEGVNAG